MAFKRKATSCKLDPVAPTRLQRIHDAMPSRDEWLPCLSILVWEYAKEEEAVIKPRRDTLELYVKRHVRTHEVEFGPSISIDDANLTRDTGFERATASDWCRAYFIHDWSVSGSLYDAGSQSWMWSHEREEIEPNQPFDMQIHWAVSFDQFNPRETVELWVCLVISDLRNHRLVTEYDQFDLSNVTVTVQWVINPRFHSPLCGLSHYAGGDVSNECECVAKQHLQRLLRVTVRGLSLNYPTPMWRSDKKQKRITAFKPAKTTPFGQQWSHYR